MKKRDYFGGGGPEGIGEENRVWNWLKWLEVTWDRLLSARWWTFRLHGRQDKLDRLSDCQLLKQHWPYNTLWTDIRLSALHATEWSTTHSDRLATSDSASWSVCCGLHNSAYRNPFLQPSRCSSIAMLTALPNSSIAMLTALPNSQSM
jgi:hypothetical protein